MLTVSGLNHYYGGSHILRDISFTVPQGACTTLLGRNGVGKTTLLKCLMGVLPVASGIITFAGLDITTSPPHQRAKLGMSYVPQGREIFARLTVEENLLTGSAVGPRAGANPIPDEILALFPVLKEMLHRRGGDLSGGQQQQLAIARALMMRPKLLILDEPTEGIQPSIIKDIERVIRLLARRGDMAILLVEQYYDFAKALADHYLVMARGEIIKSGAGAAMEEQQVRSYLAL
ncbi:MAG: urea ABC transporter ATP-binding subunit UrtE [Pseudomonadota bacterium]